MNKDLSVTKLMPRWLAGWGLAGTAVTIVASCLFLFRNVDLITAVYLSLPLALQELVFAVWLIVKGFKADCIAKQGPVHAFQGGKL